MKRCLDEGALQAYLDGELSRESALEAAEHLAACERCAASLAAAEGEGAFLAAAFAPDEALSVPTEQLRARVNAAVARLEPQGETRSPGGWSLSAILAPFTSLLTFQPQRAAAFAGLLAVVVFAAVFFSVLRPSPDKPSGGRQLAGGTTNTPPNPGSDQYARGGGTATNQAPPNNNSENVARVTGAPPVTPRVTPSSIERGGRATVAASFKRTGQPKRGAANASEAVPAAPSEQPLPGEKDYEQAIASLSRAISAGGDAVLKPKARAEYERTIAVLDKAIEETRRVARRNPKDKDAVDFLMSSYQSKVELLTTVADQAQVAALGR